MKGLLLKDFYVAVENLKMYLVIALFFIGAAIMDKNNIFFLQFLSLIGGMIPVTLLAYDERSRWTEYSLALPYSEKQIVSGKYIIGIAAPAAISVLSSIILFVVGHGFDEIILFFATSISLSCIIPALCLPFSFKFGVEKGRIAYFVVLALLVVISAFAGENGGDSSAKLPILPENYSAVTVTAILVLTAAVIYALSWIISVKLIKNRKEL